MNADGSAQTRITNNMGGNGNPPISPDGLKIAFTSFRDGNFEIYIMNADGTGQTRLTNNSVSDGDSAFSPDGSKIAFASARDGNTEIYVMNTDGSVQTNLTNNPGADGNPSFSPDGSKIVFRSSCTFLKVRADPTAEWSENCVRNSSQPRGSFSLNAVLPGDGANRSKNAGSI